MRVLWLIVALTSLGSAGACTQTTNIEEGRAALLAVDRDWSQTAKDPEKFSSYFADDGAIYPPGMPIVTGREAIGKTMAEISKIPGFALSWTAAKADVSGDIGYTTGAYEITMGGSTEKGKYVTVWKKQADGSWKVAEDIFNADAAPKAPAGTHTMLAPGELKWGPAPPALPAGAQVAVVSGDPSQPQPYVLRLQVPANFRIAPHSHPATENVTVLSGTVAYGMGDKFDVSAMQTLSAGGFATLPADMRHYFLSKTAATIRSTA